MEHWQTRSIVQKACRYPPQILEINHACASGFCLTTDQLLFFLKSCHPLFSKDDSLHVLNSHYGLFRDGPLLEEWYS